MDRYTLDWCDIYLDELLDKMGSDLFPISVKLNRFQTITLDFIREQCKLIEVTQEVSDDLKPLLVRANYTIVQNADNPNYWECPEPADYVRLVSLVPLYLDTVDNYLKQKAKIVKIYREGERQSSDRDPFQTATEDYPQVYRLANIFSINVGPHTTNYSKGLMSYIKKPTFAEIDELDKRIVNLHDTAIEQILLKTADALRFSTGDPDAGSNYQFGQTFGKRGK